jgi:hypothetical protein
MNQKQILIAVIAIVLYSCSGGFSKGVKKDLATGLSVTYNGFAIKDIYLIVDDNKLSTNKITLGKEVNVIVDGVEYFQEKDGKVFPGCSIILTDKAGKEILNLPDAFASLKDGLDKDKAGLLKAQLNTGSPMAVGETYHLKSRFFDKQNNANEIVADVDLIMKE